MRIGVFAYNFPHKKTQEGLLNLFLHQVKVECVLAADAVPLTFYQSKVRIAPKALHYAHPRLIAERLGVPYHVVSHNAPEAVEIVRSNRLDLGIILGARILKKPVIDAFGTGILNMHPGLLPMNRGLDNVKWAVLEGMPQGVTTHLISQEIDAGRLLLQREIPVFADDTLLDLHLRVQDMEQVLMLESLRGLQDGTLAPKPVTEPGRYFKAVPPEREAGLFEAFEAYKRRFAAPA